MKNMHTKKYEKLWNKIKGLIRSTTDSLDNYNKNYVKIRLNLYDELPFINYNSTFREGDKYYP